MKAGCVCESANPGMTTFLERSISTTLADSTSLDRTAGERTIVFEPGVEERSFHGRVIVMARLRGAEAPLFYRAARGRRPFSQLFLKPVGNSIKVHWRCALGSEG